jgi:hypothetical protein
MIHYELCGPTKAVEIQCFLCELKCLNRLCPCWVESKVQDMRQQQANQTPPSYGELLWFGCTYTLIL